MQPFPKVIYIYDALCGWCFGFQKNIHDLHKKYSVHIEFEVLSGNMVPVEGRQHVGIMASYIASAYQRVEELSGCKFGESYLKHIFHPEESSLHLSSEMPGIALSIFKLAQPEKAYDFAARLQNALMVDGIDLEIPGNYRNLLEGYDLDADYFVRALTTDESRDLAHAEFALVKQLGITGFPCVLVQVDERKLFMIARGYTPYEELEKRLEKVLDEFRIANN
jgi:putative protein-disulfide isomerase